METTKEANDLHHPHALLGDHSGSPYSECWETKVANNLHGTYVWGGHSWKVTKQTLRKKTKEA